MALIKMGALNGIGALINKNTFGGALIRKGALIGRRALNRIITVLSNRCRAHGLLGTRPDALPLSHRKLVRAKDAKSLFTRTWGTPGR